LWPICQCCKHFCLCEMVIWALNESNTILIPFIIDPFGGLGPITNWFLFSLQPDPAPDPFHFQSDTSLNAYDNKCLMLHPLASPTEQTSIGHAIHPTSHLVIHSIPGTQQTGSDRPLVPTLIWPLLNTYSKASTKTMHLYLPNATEPPR
jgi:hypothetical protein